MRSPIGIEREALQATRIDIVRLQLRTMVESLN